MIDALMAFPGIILALMLVAVFGTGMINTAIALGIIAIPGIARIAGAGLSSKKKPNMCWLQNWPVCGHGKL